MAVGLRHHGTNNGRRLHLSLNDGPCRWKTDDDRENYPSWQQRTPTVIQKPAHVGHQNLLCRFYVMRRFHFHSIRDTFRP